MVSRVCPNTLVPYLTRELHEQTSQTPQSAPSSADYCPPLLAYLSNKKFLHMFSNTLIVSIKINAVKALYAFWNGSLTEEENQYEVDEI